MTDPIDGNAVGQTEYMQLFMQELTYQDPLKPIDNREFMAQMAQFSALQQTTEMNGRLQQLINAQYGNQALNLLHGQDVKVKSSESYGIVKAVRFNGEKAPEVRVLMNNASEGIWVQLSEIEEVLTNYKE